MKKNTSQATFDAGKKKKKSKFWIVIVVVLVFIAIAANGNDDNTPNEPITNDTSVSTNAPVTNPPRTEPQTDPETEPMTESETEPETEAETEPETEAIILIAGEKGEYGKMITYNKGTEFEENFYAYYIPAGVYEITNIGKYTTQVNVYSDETVINEDGWEEPASCVLVKLIQVGETVEISVQNNTHIEITEPTEIALVLITGD